MINPDFQIIREYADPEQLQTLRLSRAIYQQIFHLIDMENRKVSRDIVIEGFTKLGLMATGPFVRKKMLMKTGQFDNSQIMKIEDRLVNLLTAMDSLETQVQTRLFQLGKDKQFVT